MKRMGRMVDHSAGDGRNSEHPKRASARRYLRRMLREGNIWRGGGTTFFRAKQRSFESRRTIVWKVTRGDYLVMDVCMGMLSTARTSLMLPYHRRMSDRT